MKKIYEMGNDELLAYLVSSLSKNPKKDMSLAINEIVSRMNASQQSVQRTATPEPVCTCKVTAESYNNCDAHGNRRR